MWRDISYWIHFQFICHYRHLKNQIQKKKKVSVQRTENLCIHHLGNDDGRFLAVVYDVEITLLHLSVSYSCNTCVRDCLATQSLLILSVNKSLLSFLHVSVICLTMPYATLAKIGRLDSLPVDYLQD